MKLSRRELRRRRRLVAKCFDCRLAAGAAYRAEMKNRPAPQPLCPAHRRD